MTESHTESTLGAPESAPKRVVKRKAKEAAPLALEVETPSKPSAKSKTAKKLRSPVEKPADEIAHTKGQGAALPPAIIGGEPQEEPAVGALKPARKRKTPVKKAAPDSGGDEAARVAEPAGEAENGAQPVGKARRKKSTLPAEIPADAAPERESVTQAKRGAETVAGSAETDGVDGGVKKTRRSPVRKKQAEDAPEVSPAQRPQAQQDVDVWSPGDRTTEPQAEPPKKQYPVYVPLHIAKQMEQEGKAAPLAVAADARQAAEIRAASYENRHGGGASGHSQGATAQPRDERGDRGRGQRQEREGRRSHDRPERGPQNRTPERSSPTSDRPEHGGQDRHDRHDRKRSRHDRRREGRDDHHSRGQDAHQGHHENSRELPPPTPEELSDGEGIIEISGKGFGFLRDRSRNYVQSPADIFVSPEMVRRFNLRDGQWIKGLVRKSGRGQQMHEIQSVNGDAPESSKIQPSFDELTVINPSEPLWMATTPERYTTRIIDMVAPIGKGQRGLIVAPPRTGKTTFLQHIAEAMMKNHPEVQLIMLLVDERPEEVTEIRHTVPKAEIMASSNDMDVRSHTRIAELAIERAKRLVEAGKDVFILLDSITRLGRAFNNAMTNGGRTMSGGIDARAMETPRRLFAAARNTEEAGSLTIIATALIETGSRMDEIIFQEFKGTGNMELVLDRKIAEQRIYPAVDIFQSGTRREELLVPADTLHKIHFLRRGLAGCRPSDAIDRLLFYLKKFQTNEQMLREIRG